MIEIIKNRCYRFLRQCQKYTGTDNIYLLKGGFWLTLGQFVSLGASLLTAVAFANLLDPATYGNYKYLLSLLGMLAIFSLLGVESAVTQAIARGLEGSFYTGFKTKLKWGILGSFVAVGTAAYFWAKGNIIFPVPLLISAVFFPLMQASRVYISFLSGKKLFNIQTKFGIIREVVCGVLIVSALFLTKNLLWLMTVYIVSNTFVNYAFYLAVRSKFKPNREEDPKTINYGKHASLMGIISQAATYLDKVILFGFVGPASLAVYSFATIFPENIENLLGNLNTLALPKLAPKSNEEIKKTIFKKAWKLFFLTAAVMVLYVFVAPYFFKIFFPKYLASVPYSQAYVLSFIAVPASFLATAFSAKMMKKELYFIKIANFINIVLMAAFIPFFGVWGAIMALIGAQVFKLGLVLYLFRKF